jgi:glycosyltransferase involved in cell wall biosynthesis
MKLWIVSNLPPPVHGVSVFNALLVRELRRSKIVTKFYRVGSQEHAARLGLFEPRKLVRDAWTLLRFLVSASLAKIREAGPHVLYFTPSQSGLSVYRDLMVSGLGRRLLGRVVGHIHGCGWITLRKAGGPESTTMMRALRQCDAVICLGETFAGQMHLETGLRCVAVNNGTPEVPGAVPKQLPSGGNTIHLLFLSNFILSKGLFIAAEAAQILRGRGYVVTLKCAGSWRDIATSQAFDRKFRSEVDAGVIRVVGPVDEAKKASLFQEAHFFLLPTRYPLEGQPLALIEAMSWGVVPLTTDQGGIPDLMRFEGGSQLASSELGSPHGLARGVESMVRSPGRYEELSSRCLARHRSALTFTECARQIINLLIECGGDVSPRSGKPSRVETAEARREEVATPWVCQ